MSDFDEQNIRRTDWTIDVEDVLERIRKNSSILSDEHKHTYFRLKNTLQYFRLPLIVISGINSVIAVGMQNYLEQKAISGITCVLSLICSVIGSIELFLAIQKRVEAELISSREYYLLSIDIQKTLLLTKDHRPVPAKDYLEKIYNNYIKLTESSNLVKKTIKDALADIPSVSPTNSRPITPIRTPHTEDLEWGLSLVSQ
jgi:hypothetical protein